jgi:outer membrane protein OmpA-like peptidoglycan-associated protein
MIDNPVSIRPKPQKEIAMRRKLKIVTAICVVAFAAAACATKTQTGAAAGAGGGALLGAGIGALVGGGKGAAVGAGVGAAAGAGTGALIGRYMDKQEAKLKEVKSAKVEREGNKLVVKFNSAILFDTDKADLKAGSRSDLAEFANVLKEYKDTDLVIEGHTDSTGKKDHNKRLSVRRAEAVMSFLDSAGVARSRMTGKGYADDMPVGDNATAEGRQANRRVQIQIAANEQLQKQDAQAAGQTTSSNP